MESWKIVWRDGFLPSLSTTSLEKLRDALHNDDCRLTQGSTTTPPPLMSVQDFPVEAACALGFCYVAENGGFAEIDSSGNQTNPDAATVGQTEALFARCCFEADQRLGEPAASRWFLNWFDDTNRDLMRIELLGEAERALALRAEVVAA